MDLKVDMVQSQNCVLLKLYNVDNSVYCGGLPEKFACKKQNKIVAKNKLVGNFLWLGSRGDECRSVYGRFLAPAVRLMSVFWRGVDFPGGAAEKKTLANETQETWVQFLGREDPLEEEMATHSSILAWECRGRRSLAGYSPCGHKELDMTEWAHTVHRGAFT